MIRQLRLLLVLVALSACGTVELTAKRDVDWQRRPGKTCFVRLELDGGDQSVEVSGPNACVPPPEFCAPGPGETP